MPILQKVKAYKTSLPDRYLDLRGEKLRYFNLDHQANGFVNCLNQALTFLSPIKAVQNIFTKNLRSYQLTRGKLTKIIQ